MQTFPSIVQLLLLQYAELMVDGEPYVDMENLMSHEDREVKQPHRGRLLLLESTSDLLRHGHRYLDLFDPNYVPVSGYPWY